MRVLYVAHTALMSGAEGALIDLLAELPASLVCGVACPRGPLADVVARMGIEVLELPSVSGSFRLGPAQTPHTVADLARAGIALRRAMKRSQATVIHANTLRAGLVAGAGAARRNIPVILHAHDTLPASRSGAVVGAALGMSADSLITISDFTADTFAARFAGRTEVLYNPLDTVRFDPARRSRAVARAELGLAADTPLLGLVAQLTPWKGQDLAIRALDLLTPHFADLRLLIVGKAVFSNRATGFDNRGYVESLHALVAELGLEGRVEFWGQRDDTDRVIRALDVLLNPSWAEPFGRSLVEAMALETPVISTDVGGPVEFIDHGLDGLLVPPHDPIRWAQSIATLLDDGRLRAEMGRRASDKVRRRFDRRDYAAAVISVYERTLAAHPPRRHRR